MHNKSLPKLKWLVIDGLPYNLIKKFGQSNFTPCLAEKFKDPNTCFKLEPLYPNCQTPPSLFSIWSGRDAIVHGIIGFDTPDIKNQNPVGMHNGFDRWPNHLMRIWDLYAMQGKKVRLNHVPFVDDLTLGPHLLSRTNGYEGLEIASDVIDANTSYFAKNGDEIKFNFFAHDTCEVTVKSKSNKQKRNIHADVFTDVFLSDGSGQITFMPTILEHGKHICILGKSKYVSYGASSADAPPSSFYGLSFAKLYRTGKLGKKIIDGGNGKAEEILFKSLEKVHYSFSSEIIKSFESGDAELCVAYYPIVDLALHEIMRGLFSDESSSVYRNTSKYVLLILQWCDSIISNIIRSLKPDERLLINSDHGMQPVWNTFYLNESLRREGLLNLTTDGSIDWGSTKIAYHAAENGTLIINRSMFSSDYLSNAIDLINYQFKKNGIPSAQVYELPFGGSDYLDTSLFLCSPDGTRVKANCAYNPVGPCNKSGDHCNYSKNEWLKGVIFTFNFPQLSIKNYQTYELLSLVLCS